MTDLPKVSAAYERAMLQTFNGIVADIKNNVVMYELIRALEVGDVAAVIQLLGLDEETWEPLQYAISEAYRAGGITAAEQIGVIPAAAGTTAFRFNARAPAAERWVATRSSELITEVVREQREIVRELLTEALTNGTGPRETALEIVGRLDPVRKVRVGGVVGLTEAQHGWIRNARAELSELDPNYLTRKLRDKRFDSMVKKAIKTGQPLPQAKIDAAITQMQARALKYRGEVIARTESINALRAGQWESILQAVTKGELDPRDVTKTWDATGDARTRADHLLMEGQEVPLLEVFTAPDASRLRDASRLLYPGDTSQGATAAQTIQCRCKARYTIDFGARLRRIEGFS